MSLSDDVKQLVTPQNRLLASSALLLVWNLVGFDLPSLRGTYWGFLNAVPRGVVPVVLIVLIAYLSFATYRDANAVPRRAPAAFLTRVDSGIAYLLAASAIASYFSRLSGEQLVLEIQRLPACLILSGIGWTLMIPSGFALAQSKSNELLSQGLTIIGPLMFGFGVMGVWVAVTIAGNVWPAWLGAWAGLLPGVLLVRAWDRR